MKHNKEIDHEYTDEIVCPYCGSEQGESWERADDGRNECGDCEKKSMYQRHVSVSYSTKKSPCLNGEAPHELRKIYDHNGKNKMKCRNCDHEEWVDQK